jgi:hypothetical protein
MWHKRVVRSHWDFPGCFYAAEETLIDEIQNTHQYQGKEVNYNIFME